MPNVSSVKSKQFVQGTHDSKVSANGTATSLVITDGGPWINAQTVTVSSLGGNNTTINFVVVGTDENGAAQTGAATSGPTAGATKSMPDLWLSVTSITSSGPIVTDIEAGVTAGAASGTLFAGRTRVRGMAGSGAGAGHLNFKNTSANTNDTYYIEILKNNQFIKSNRKIIIY